MCVCVHMCHIILIHSSVDGCLVYFHVWDFVNKCCNEHGSAHTSLWCCFQFLWIYIEKWDCWTVLSFWLTSILFSIACSKLHISTNRVYTCFQFLHMLTNTYCPFYSLNSSSYKRCEILRCACTCGALMIVLNIFLCTYFSSCVLFGEMTKSFAYF